eukprot:scaffold73164_cov69-Phaeocystis_antarctica.AAC.3
MSFGLQLIHAGMCSDEQLGTVWMADLRCHEYGWDHLLARLVRCGTACQQQLHVGSVAEAGGDA